MLPVLFMGLFFFYPLLAIFSLSFRPEGVWDFSGFLRIVTTPYYIETLFFTLWQALLSTALTLLLAIPSAYVFVRYQFPFRRLLLTLSSLPFVLPTVVVATALQALLGNNGVVNTLLKGFLSLENAPIQLERTLGFILIAHVFYNYAVALRMISGYWANQSLRLEEAAQLLGASGWRLWWEVRLPMLRPAIVASGVLVFIFTFTSFGIVLILGGVRFSTLEVQIYYQAVNVFDLPMAGALSLVQLGIMAVMMGVYTRLQRQNSVDLAPTRLILKPIRRWSERLAVLGVTSLMSTLLFAPLAVLVWASLTYAQDTPSLHYYGLLDENVRGSALFVSPLMAVANSLQFAAITTILALILGIIASLLIYRYPIADVVFMLPLATSAVTLGFGFILVLDTPPLQLRSSWVIIPIAHTLVALPFVIRSVLPALRAIPHHTLESARLLGASTWRVRREVMLPLIGRGIGVGAVFAFTVSMGEFGASLFVARPNTPTLPIAIFRLLGQPMRDNYGQALALSVILLLCCAAGFLLIERLRDVGAGEF